MVELERNAETKIEIIEMIVTCHDMNPEVELADTLKKISNVLEGKSVKI